MASKLAGLAAADAGDRVAVHRVARPHHRVAGVADGTQQRAQRVLHLVGTHAADQREPAGDARRVQLLAQLEHERRRRWLGPTLQPIGLPTPRRNSTCAPSSWRVRSPIHSMCAEQSYQPPVSESCAGERFLVAEQQRLVAGVHVGLVQLVVGLGVDAAGAHEAQRTVDLAGELLVALALGAAGDELLGPRVHPAEVGEAALGERAQQVQRGGRLVVGLHQPLGVGDAGGLGGRVAVDDVAAEAGQLEVADLLGVAGARLGELAGDAADLHHRHAERVGEHDRHLQDDAQLLADVDGARTPRSSRRSRRPAAGTRCRRRPGRATLCSERASPANTSGG